MGTIDRNDASVEVAKMRISRFEEELANPHATPASLEDAHFPLFGIRWSHNVAAAIGSKRLNHILAIARNSPLPTTSYNSSDSRLKEAMADECSYPSICGNGCH